MKTFFANAPDCICIAYEGLEHELVFEQIDSIFPKSFNTSLPNPYSTNP